MNKYFVQTPCIIPLREPWFFDIKTLDDQTKIELSCDIGISEVDIFYTIDGTKPEPYISIVQGSKTYKYDGPFTLPLGKVTVKAIAVQREFQDLRSNVITKTFTVAKSKAVPKSAIGALPRASKPVCEKEDAVKPTTHPLPNINKSLYEKEVMPISTSNPLLSTNNSVHEKEDLYTSDVETAQSSELVEDDYVYDESSAHSDMSLVEGSDFKEPVPQQKAECDLSESESNTNLVDDIKHDQVLKHENIFDNSIVTEKQEENVKIENEALEADVPYALEHCILCGKLRDYYPKYCPNCCRRLYELCSKCGKLTICVANYCQYCGAQFLSKKEDSKDEFKKQTHAGIMVEPSMEDRSSNTLSFLDRAVVHSVQTSPVHDSPHAQLLPIKPSRSRSPGHGFWRVQTDFICTELKTHANNNLKFRNQIGSPVIRRLHSAQAQVEDSMFVIQIKFEMCKHQS